MSKLTLEEAFVTRIAWFQKEAYRVAAEHGFHKSLTPDPVAFLNRQSIATAVANLHGEVSEFWEAYRKDKITHQCDKHTSESLTCAEEELADIVIRAMDTAEALGIDLGRAILVKHEYNKGREFKHGKIA